jgi:hypothetical protein
LGLSERFQTTTCWQGRSGLITSKIKEQSFVIQLLEALVIRHQVGDELPCGQYMSLLTA